MRPFRITIDTNPDLCNLNCIMCDTHSKFAESRTQRKSMPKELLERILDQAIEIGVKEIIPSTMGEPLLYEHFDLFIKKLINTNIKLNLTTNGSFPYYTLETWADKLIPVLSDIKISINSLKPDVNERIMINDSTLKKIENIKKFVFLRNKYNSHVTITLQVTFMRSNIDSLEEIIDFAIDNNLDRVKGHQLWITNNHIGNEAIMNDDVLIGEWNNFLYSIKDKRKSINLVNFNLIDSSAISDKNCNFSCPFLGRELWINHEGSYDICCAPSNIRNLFGYWGNIKDKTILSLFDSSEYLSFFNSYKSNKVCKTCPLRKIE